MPLKYFRYYATDSEVLIFMSKGSNPNDIWAQEFLQSQNFFHS